MRPDDLSTGFRPRQDRKYLRVQIFRVYVRGSQTGIETFHSLSNRSIYIAKTCIEFGVAKQWILVVMLSLPRPLVLRGVSAQTEDLEAGLGEGLAVVVEAACLLGHPMGQRDIG